MNSPIHLPDPRTCTHLPHTPYAHTSPVPPLPPHTQCTHLDNQPCTPTPPLPPPLHKLTPHPPVHSPRHPIMHSNSPPRTHPNPHPRTQLTPHGMHSPPPPAPTHVDAGAPPPTSPPLMASFPLTPPEYEGRAGAPLAHPAVNSSLLFLGQIQRLQQQQQGGDRGEQQAPTVTRVHSQEAPAAVCGLGALADLEEAGRRAATKAANVAADASLYPPGGLLPIVFSPQHGGPKWVQAGGEGGL